MLVGGAWRGDTKKRLHGRLEQWPQKHDCRSILNLVKILFSFVFGYGNVKASVKVNKFETKRENKIETKNTIET